MELVNRFFREPGGGYFLFGPRGTGKSTWLKAHHTEALTIDLLDPEIHRTLLARPERLAEILKGSPEQATVVLDEIQRAPQLLDVIHANLESESRRRFILTGSSARKLRRGVGNLLGGRLTEATLHPFMASELGDRFDLDRALEFGLVPVVVDAEDPLATRNAYASLYLKEEVQAEGLVRNIGGFSRFLEAISFSHGAVLNIANIARECEIGQKTASGFLEVLEDLLLAFRLPVFAKRAKRHLIKHAKFYYFDCGVFRSLRPTGPLDQPSEIGGAALEGLIAQHLRAWIDYSPSGRDCRLFFWRTKSNTEVDFVVYGPEVFWALEIKHARRVQARDTRGLRTFAQDYPEAQTALLYMGNEKLEIDGVRCIPCGAFLENLYPGCTAIPATD